MAIVGPEAIDQGVVLVEERDVGRQVSTLRHATDWVSSAPTIISVGVSAGHEPRGPKWAKSCWKISSNSLEAASRRIIGVSF